MMKNWKADGKKHLKGLPSSSSRKGRTTKGTNSQESRMSRTKKKQ